MYELDISFINECGVNLATNSEDVPIGTLNQETSCGVNTFQHLPFVNLEKTIPEGIYSIHKKAYSTAVMSFIIMVMNIYGYIQWVS